MGNQILRRGQSFTIRNVQPGYWDLRVVDQSRHWKEWRNVRVEAGGGYLLQVNAGGWHRSG